MKSRISFFNRTAFRKDLTRFAPAWGLYAVGLLLVYAVLMIENTYYRARNLADLMAFMAVLNFGYGILNAQLLFGDLFNARMCNALHAMPLRRETWYGTHLAAGLSFSIVPNFVFAVVCTATMNLGAAWSVPLWWLLGSTLQYLCFFGIGVLCVMLTGNRFACGVVYGLVNFFSVLVYWLVSSLYEPLLIGIRVRQEPFTYGSPVVNMVAQDAPIEVIRERLVNAYGDFQGWKVTGVALGDSWSWLVVYAAVGVVMLGLGLLLYRARKLECAGDFMAFRAGEPVLLIVYTLTVGGIFHLLSEAFSGGPEKYMFLVIGLAVGYFTGQMLLQRTTRVFRKRAFAAFGIFLLVFSGSLLLTWLDPLGLTRWVPDGDYVVSVNLSNRYAHYGYSEREMDLTAPEDIQNILAAHADALAQSEGTYFEEPGYYANVQVCLEYTLKNGATRTRFYEVNALSQAGQLLKPYFSSFEFVTGFREDQIPQLAKDIFHVYTEGSEGYMEGQTDVQELDVESLLRAIAADCAAGNMSQFGSYHLKEDENGNLDWTNVTYLEFGYNQIAPNTGEPAGFYIYMTLYENSVHTINWLKENNLFNPEKFVG